MPVPRAIKSTGSGVLPGLGTELQFCKMKTVLEMDGDADCANMDVLSSEFSLPKHS